MAATKKRYSDAAKEEVSVSIPQCIAVLDH
jgi:hypothetical protein